MDIYKQKLTDTQFQKLVTLIEKESGNRIQRKEPLEIFLRVRLPELNLQAFSDYVDYIFSAGHTAKELVHLIDGIAINKTDFFREPGHFQFLVQTVLPELITRTGAGINREMLIWSAGCSTGEEPYTISMVLSAFQQLQAPGLNLRFSVLATDISTKALASAEKAVYSRQKLEQIPGNFWHYIMEHKDHKQHVIKIAPEIRARVSFRRINLMEGNFQFRERIDIVFFRNVMIYFDRETQQKVLNRITEVIQPRGYFFIGHSESLHGFNLPVRNVAPTIYQKIS